MHDYDRWPASAPDQILPRLFQGGTEDDDVSGEVIPADHYRGERRFDRVVTPYADAQPAPWGAEKIHCQGSEVRQRLPAESCRRGEVRGTNGQVLP